MSKTQDGFLGKVSKGIKKSIYDDEPDAASGKLIIERLQSLAGAGSPGQSKKAVERTPDASAPSTLKNRRRLRHLRLSLLSIPGIGPWRTPPCRQRPRAAPGCASCQESPVIRGIRPDQDLGAHGDDPGGRG